MRDILTIMKKELKRFFTDKRMLLSLILPGVVIYFVYSLMGNFMGEAFMPSQEYKYKIGVNEVSEDITEVFDLTGFEYETETVKTVNEGKEKVKNSQIDAFVFCERNSGGDIVSVEIFYNSTSVESSNFYNACYSIFYAKSVEIKEVFKLNAFGDTYDLATVEDLSKMLFTMLIPFLMLIFLYSGAMAVATESIAGEKERGTIATLLVTPVKRSYIALGKVFALSLTATVSAVVSFLGVILSLPKLLSGAGDELVVTAVYGLKEYLGLFIVIILTVVLFTVMLSIISTISKSVKEASSLAVPVMVLVMVVGISGFLMGTGNAKPSYLCLIPIYNAVQCMGEILSTGISILSLVFTLVSNLIFIALGILLLTKLFSNEKVMFNK